MSRALAMVCLLASASAQESRFTPQGPQLASPARPGSGPAWRVVREEWRAVQAADYDAWFSEADRWRREHLARIGYSGAEYDRPELNWS